MIHFCIIFIIMKNINPNFKDIEILSPAGNPECFFAGLNNGANAIYLGLSDFNARMRAENFTTENIREYIKIAHSHGVKVYVTINTLIKDEDFDKLVNMVKKLCEAKTDAFIVQDLGVAYVLKKCFKNICLHASTQMGIHNLAGAKIAEKLGFSQIVLSRETKLSDIKQIRENTNLAIEYFVQGALCVAFSGNCYLSSLENNASGNEGKCLQLCRLPYKNNLTNEEKYYLSTHDLCLLENLQDLIDAGVTSFKIEGRLRHAGYVATATNAYSEAIKNIAKNSFNKDFISFQKERLTETFSRGKFNTMAYLAPNVPDKIIYPDFQNHIGKKIGTVISVKPFKDDLFKVELQSKEEIHSGDGLKIISGNNQLASLGVGNITKLKNGNYEIITKNKFPSKTDVYLTQNAEYEQSLLNNKRKIMISAKIIANKNEKLKLILSSENVSEEYNSDFILQEAKNMPLSSNDFVSQFAKFNDFPFALNDINVTTNGVFIPKSELNKIRRDSLQNFYEKIISENEKHLNVSYDDNEYISLKNAKNKIKSENLYIIDETFSKFEESKTYVLSPANFGESAIKLYNENCDNYNICIFVPTLLCANDFAIFDNFLNKLNKKPTLFANNIGALNFASDGYEIIASPLLNIKNNYAIKCLNSLNINFICASTEASDEFINQNKLTAFSSGYFPLMTFAHCPYKTIYENTCKTCKFKNGLIYSKNKNNYSIFRTKLANCQFVLCKPVYKNSHEFNIINLKNS